MDRRSALAALAGALAGTALPDAGLAALGSGPNRADDRIERIGLQLYTVRELLAEEFEGTLERVAEIGYREVEFAGYFGHDPGEVRDALGRVGLEAPAAHVPLEALESDWERTLESARLMGHRYLVVAFLPADRRRSLDDYRRVADLLDRAGARAREAGIRLGYHNHAFEFEALEGRLPYDVLLKATDPELVLLEVDLFWIRRGGADPLEYVDRYPGRIHMVHVKDMAESGEMVDVGDGTIDFARVFAGREKAGIRHFFVEHDRPRDPLASIRASYRYLRALEL